MKFNRIVLFAVVLALFATLAFAGPIAYVKDLIGWKVIAFVVSSAMLVGGVATKARLLSGALIAIGAIFSLIGGVINWVGVVLQDGKIDDKEMKQAWPLLKSTWADIGKSWASLKKPK